MTDPVSSISQRSLVVWLCLAALVIIGSAVFSNNLRGPFIFDDTSAITNNTSIRHLWPPEQRSWRVFVPPKNSPVAGRPVVNLTLAINYAISEYSVVGYHVVNVIIHLLCALLIFGIVRRTLSSPVLREHFGSSAIGLASAISLLWMIHPLTTECVNYLTQRSESIMAMFFLLTLYASIRADQSLRPMRWWLLAIGACALGMLSKESMVTAPVIVVLYSLIFHSRDIRTVIKKQWRFWMGLAATWVVLGAVMIAGPREDSVGFTDTQDPITLSFQYAISQSDAIVDYFQLVFWPMPLKIDYGIFNQNLQLGDVFFQVGVLATILFAVGLALVRRPKLGFLGAWVFIILSPTSSVVPIMTEVAAERRMYLPLVAIVSLIVILAYMFYRRFANVVKNKLVVRTVQSMAAALSLVVACGLGYLTIERNQEYHSGITLWSAAVRAQPKNERAHLNLGYETGLAGDRTGAIIHYRRAIELKNDYKMAHNHLGNALRLDGDFMGAVRHFRRVIDIDPAFAAGYYNLGLTLRQGGRLDDAINYFKQALEVDPKFTFAQNSLGSVMESKNDLIGAIEFYRQALETNPEYVLARINLANALVKSGRYDEAILQCKQVIRLQPDAANAHYTLGNVYGALKRFDEAILAYKQTLVIEPDHAKAMFNLGYALHLKGLDSLAIEKFRQAIALDPDYLIAHVNLASTLDESGHHGEAIAEYLEAARIAPNSPDIQYSLGMALCADGRPDEAADAFISAARMAPNLSVDLLGGMAWMLAVHPTSGEIARRTALGLARRAIDKAGTDQNPTILDILATALASNEDWDQAISTARQALDMARQQGQAELADQIESRLQGYEQRLPYQEPASSPR